MRLCDILGRRTTIAGAAWLVLVVGARAGDWPQFLGPGRNGVSAETGLRTSWPREGPPLLWQKQIGAGFSSPVVAGRRLILFHRLGDREAVECLDAEAGTPQWKHAYPTGYRDDFGFDDGPRATPVVAGQRVYTMGAAGTLLCLDLETGRKIWERSLMTDYHAPKGFFGIAGTPLVEGDLLLVNVGARGAGIVAFHRETGKEVWKATDQAASYSSPVAATVHGQRYAFFFTRQGLVALDPASGAVRYSKTWRSRIDASVNAATPIVVDDAVFISASYGTGAILLRFTPTGVEDVWHNDESMSNHYATCVYYQDHLYGFDGRQEEGARLRCVEWKTGKVCWTEERFGCGSMIVADGKLIILNEAGELVLAEATPEAYREKARAAVLSKPTRAAPALANGRLYARDTQRLICVNLKK